MISKQLELCLNTAVETAREYKHEHVTVEHILYALLGDKSILLLFSELGGSVEQVKKHLDKFFRENLENIRLNEVLESPRPTIGFQRVLQNAAQHVLASGKEVIHCSSVFVAIFHEKNSHARYFIEQQQINK